MTNIYKGSGGSPILKINGNSIHKGSGGSPILKINGDSIHKGSGGSPLYKGFATLNTGQLIAVLYALGEIPNMGSKKSGKGGCFIATATMGNYDHPVVLKLREFRDQYLNKRNWGKVFIKYYYLLSPYPSNIISKSNFLKKVSYLIIIQPLSFIVKIIMNNQK